ncbi:MAG: hypothetical protein RIQ33_2499 [Bacteroidota bacterium]|jgi:FtsH-binding integral membrane protein
MNTTILDNSETIYPINHQVLLNKYITKVFGWMSLALILTGITSLVVVSSETLLNTIFSSKLSFYLLIGAEFLLVMAITSLINKMSTPLAFLLFVVYSILNGITLSVIFLVYTAGSIASTFFITAGTFAIMSIVGYFTKKDLTSFGQILFMIFIGLMIASLVNFFMNSDTLYWICTYAGVIVFTGLTAYDTQKIKNIGIDAINQNMDTSKMALMGALNLYLDFINLFLFLLRLFGRRK